MVLKTIQEKAQAVLNVLDCPDGELSILIVDDREITELNKQYFNKEKPTNVISFAMNEGDFSDLTPYLLGDVVISADTAQKEGDVAGISMEERFLELLVHGILHIFGYNHEHSEHEAELMESKSKELLEKIST